MQIIATQQPAEPVVEWSGVRCVEIERCLHIRTYAAPGEIVRDDYTTMPITCAR